jgi:uncharacterized repeat protein (TIGR01451 family)
MKTQKLLGYLLVSAALVLVLSVAAVASGPAAPPDPARYDPTAHDLELPTFGVSIPEPIRPAQAAATGSARNNAAGGPIIIDHTCTGLDAIPEYWMERAKERLRISYGHTSHGSQPISGMGVLMAGPLNVNGLYDFNTNGAVMTDVLSIADGTPSGDLGNPDRTTWATRTREYLNGSGNDRNVVVWSWCGQADTTAENIDLYLNLMDDLERDYPEVTFVYMTGHLNGTGETGGLNQRNNQIRDYCVANGKILFDFADIESYDPDGDYYLDRGADDGCNYDGGNWADEWCAAHPDDPLCEPCECAHSEALNCNLKARAFWWMMARVAGWSGAGPQKTASTETAIHSQAVTYTIVVRDTGAPLTATIYLTDEVPLGLSYVPGTITATAGTATDTNAPFLYWSGVLTPTPVVTVTYAVTVSAIAPQAVTNSAVVVVPGYSPITRTATLSVVLPSDYPNLTPSFKTVSSRFVDYGERITYTVGIRNDAGPLSQTVHLTDTIPDGLSYVPGTLVATTGTVTDTYAPSLRWSGLLTPSADITVTYAVTVTPPAAGSARTVAFPRTNTAVIVAPGYPPVTRTATVLTNPYHIFLPSVLRES